MNIRIMTIDNYEAIVFIVPLLSLHIEARELVQGGLYDN